MTTSITTTYNVTDEQIAKAHRTLDLNTNETFYHVESQSEACLMYRVSYLAEKKAIVCTCKAGQEGRNCWHKRAAKAAAALYRQEEEARQEAERQAMERPLNVNPDCEAMISRLEGLMRTNASINQDWREQCHKAAMKA